MLAFLTLASSFIIAQDGGDQGGGGGISAGSYTVIIWIAVFIAIFYFLLIRPGQKQSKKHEELVSSIHKGDEVLTSGGLYGKVTKVADDYVMIEIAKKTEVKLARGSIASRTSIEAEEAAEAEEVSEPEEASPAEPESKKK